MIRHWGLSILIAALSFIAIVSATDTSEPSDATLWGAIPDCAKLCVQNFIEGQYNTAECASGSDIKCLCRNKTPSGLTLGEAALSCLYALCAETDISLQGSRVYHVCSPVSGAVVETHSVIIATTFDPPQSATTMYPATTATGPSSTSPSSSPSLSQTSSSSILFTSSFSSPSSTAPTETVSQTTRSTSTKTTTASSDTSTPTTSIASASSTSSSASSSGATSHVSSSTVIGVSVASGVAGAFLIGIAVFLCCKRWRQRSHASGFNSDHDDFFEIGGTMSEPADFSRSPSQLSPRGPHSGPRGSFPLARGPGSGQMSELPTTRTPTWQNPTMAPTVRLLPTAPDSEKPLEREPIGVAVSSRDGWANSPRSLSSSQNVQAESSTTPVMGLHPKPLKWSLRPDSGGTLFEEDEYQQIRAPQPLNMQSTACARPLPGLPANPRAFKNKIPPDHHHGGSSPPPPQQQRARPGHQGRFSPQSSLSSDRVVGPNMSTTAFRSSPPSNPSSSSNNDSGSSYRGSASIPVALALMQGQEQRQGQGQGHGSSVRPIHRPRPSPRNFDPRRSPALSGKAPGGPRPAASPPQVPSHPPQSPNNGLGLSAPPDQLVQPRIVSREEIKHVEIRSSPRLPGEVVAPYGPDDFWPERGRSRAPVPHTMKALPYPSEIAPGKVLYPQSPHKRPRDIQAQRLSATGRSLTPSKRGDDLILRVEE
ncbi:hypothetical protein PDE_04830 [Penicillium oxalicum 114-2]|uniref:CFEM domain-containing protein n=1 Tax=Penicillium oxalicum (strain 114-2 / CGMCC 5302) TaxID=933388 RepID=S7ZGU3_PENO1|nr:hypothetical protein PDE_04830 [Penicillium oxalicum 114-2]